MQINELKPGKVFVFIDETGDPGHPDHPDASRMYQLNITVTTRPGIREIVKHFSRFRYFREADKELEKYIRSLDIIHELFTICSSHPGIAFYSFYLQKEAYVGPYLKSIGVGKHDYNPTLFKNFIVRTSLESLFEELLPKGSDVLFQKGLEFELVFDRYLPREIDEQNLRQYLQGNYKLPPFSNIVQVDSEYSDLIQVTDVLGTLVKQAMSGGDSKLTDFISLYCLENPRQVEKRRGPGHS